MLRKGTIEIFMAEIKEIFGTGLGLQLQHWSCAKVTFFLLFTFSLQEAGTPHFITLSCRRSVNRKQENISLSFMKLSLYGSIASFTCTAHYNLNRFKHKRSGLYVKPPRIGRPNPAGAKTTTPLRFHDQLKIIISSLPRQYETEDFRKFSS